MRSADAKALGQTRNDILMLIKCLKYVERSACIALQQKKIQHAADAPWINL